MVIDDYYTVNIAFNGQNIEIAPQEFSFALSDSIYSLYNYGTFELNDVTGLLQEYFTTTEGAEVTLGYGTTSDLNTAHLMIKQDELSEIQIPGYLSGPVNIELINYWYHNQEIKSKAYQNSIASLINSLVAGKGFSAIDIENTGNNDLWYQMMITDAKFIQEILLPNAYSSGSQTPFYAYITSDNAFHLKSLKSMIDTTPTATIEYRPPTPKDKGVNLTTSIRKLRQGSDIHRPLLKRRIFEISRTDGELVEEDPDGIGSYPTKGTKNIPIMNYTNVSTGYYDSGFSETNVGRKDNHLGKKINSMKDSVFLDRFVIIQPLNPKLLSGKLVQLNIYISSGDGDQISKHYSGKYVIENSEHIWDGNTQRGFTKTILGRKYTGTIPGAYLLKTRLS